MKASQREGQSASLDVTHRRGVMKLLLLAHQKHPLSSEVTLLLTMSWPVRRQGSETHTPQEAIFLFTLLLADEDGQMINPRIPTWILLIVLDCWQKFSYLPLPNWVSLLGLLYGNYSLGESGGPGPWAAAGRRSV